MSGGHFNDNGYIYYQVMQFADELESDIRRNAIKDEYGWAHNLNDEAIAYLKSKIAEVRPEWVERNEIKLSNCEDAIKYWFKDQWDKYTSQNLTEKGDN